MLAAKKQQQKVCLQKKGLCSMSLLRHCFSTGGPLMQLKPLPHTPLSAGLQPSPHRSVYRAGGPRQSNTLPRRHGGDGLIRHPTEHRFHPSALRSVSTPDGGERMIVRCCAGLLIVSPSYRRYVSGGTWSSHGDRSGSQEGGG